jgi:hypothetical protein
VFDICPEHFSFLIVVRFHLVLLHFQCISSAPVWLSFEYDVWTYIKHKRKDIVGISSLKMDGKLYCDPVTKSNILYRQFKSAFSEKTFYSTEGPEHFSFLIVVRFHLVLLHFQCISSAPVWLSFEYDVWESHH